MTLFVHPTIRSWSANGTPVNVAMTRNGTVQAMAFTKSPPPSSTNAAMASRVIRRTMSSRRPIGIGVNGAITSRR